MKDYELAELRQIHKKICLQLGVEDHMVVGGEFLTIVVRNGQVRHFGHFNRRRVNEFLGASFKDARAALRRHLNAVEY